METRGWWPEKVWNHTGLNFERGKLQILECIVFSRHDERDIDSGLTLLLWLTYCDSFES